ncbi:SapC family protein [Citromicrobium bathyomarinum]|uniref:SapC family protein n=1 Tax=Citromicrobium bathyomarinum TaxID=72174 RepID=UPI003159E3CB
MASEPQQTQLPMFYEDLMPLNSRDHKKFHNRMRETAPYLAKQHMVPLTAEEFVQVARHYPIIFSTGENPLPLALMGLNEGVNTFFDENGKAHEPVYVPAYVRRYPFMLARLTAESEDLSLCFDPTCDAVGDFSEGDALFNDDGSPTEHTQAILNFCEQFEQAGHRTKLMTDELVKHGLLMDGEVSIERNSEPGKPYVYKGFQMVDQNKLRELDGETIARWNKDGMLPLIYAHLASLDLLRVIFARQQEQGKLPAQAAAPAQ